MPVLHIPMTQTCIDHLQEDDELDMLDQASRQEAEGEEEAYLKVRAGLLQSGSQPIASILPIRFAPQGSRLCCQIQLWEEHDGLEITLPDSVHNMLEVPLWMRNR